MKTAIVLGAFDGLHSGHRAVIEKALDCYSVAVTFDIPPKYAVSGEGELLILPDDKECRLRQLGINQVVMQKFDDIKDMQALDYLELLKKEYNPNRIVCGFNYRFGKNAVGDTGLLESYCNQNNIEFVCVPAVLRDGEVISSTNIRDFVRQGRVDLATELMYGGFGFTAQVLHGDKRGRTIGFPTANQNYPGALVKPKFGVYISRITVNGKQYDAITNVGVRPTYRTDVVGCESYIKDFCEDIYGASIRTELLCFVRGEQKFSSLDQLKKAIENDVDLLQRHN